MSDEHHEQRALAGLKMKIAAIRLRSRSGWIIFSALLLSLMLHLGLLFMPQIHLILFPNTSPQGIDADLVSMLKVRIAQPPPVAPTPAPIPIKPAPPKRPVKMVGPVLAAPDTSVPAKIPEKTPDPAPAESTADDATVAEEEVVPTAEEVAASTHQPLPPATEPTPTEPTPTEAEVSAVIQPASEEKTSAEPHPPLKLVVNYALLKGKNGIKIGHIVHTWDIDDGRYVIASVVEPIGLARLLTREMIVQSSQGRITADGLVPESYWEQRGQKADRTFHAEFDYDQQTLTYGGRSETTTVVLPPGTQDQLSFIYQFGLKAPFSGTLQFSMTTGRKLGTYRCEVVGEELIDSGLGELRTLHLRKILNAPSDDSIEIWLAADHQYLPVKVRITNSEGDVLEQVVEGIDKK